MLTVYPDYYPLFHCAADRCEHTCCAGWEIDVDAETVQKYRALSGPLAARMESALAMEPEPHFRLGPENRCPFLNGRGLCDLILAGGEDLLCGICRDHPRYRSFLPGRTEIGVGLCCEAAAELILSRQTPITLLAEGTEEPADENAAALVSLRDALLAAARDRTMPLPARMERVLTLSGAGMPERSMARWAEFYLRLERLDAGWSDILTDLRSQGDSVDITSFLSHMQQRGHEYEQLFSYFLFRHVLSAWDDGDPAGKAAFSVLSVRILFTLGAIHFAKHGDFTFTDQREYARMYSAEIEYSQENLDAIFDALANGYGKT